MRSCSNAGALRRFLPILNSAWRQMSDCAFVQVAARDARPAPPLDFKDLRSFRVKSW
ncbi:hypothetical protein HMPREF0970_00392 [Schaalia odontolytica F0309]|uniref:Uncharacterized protein n=1 Tax=Schaalia odontolytica F0309 TaxID=649742 RepID=D4TWT1_9ACTO|nr:hypothetical protein HMPREF0970_00392 [Schaalia odontolytica F0309]